MNKELNICVSLIVLSVGGWFASKQYTAYQAKKAVQAQQVATQAAARQQEAQKPQIAAQEQNKQQLAAETENKKQQAAQGAVRQELTAQLKSLKLSSIVLGSPNLVIINKKTYEEGNSLVLANGKAVKITAIKADGVVLADGNETFQLDLPTARDIGMK